MADLNYGGRIQAVVVIQNIGKAPGTFQITGYVHPTLRPSFIYPLKGEVTGEYPIVELYPGDTSWPLTLITDPITHQKPGDEPSPYKGVVTNTCLETGEFVNNMQENIAMDVGDPQPAVVSVVYSVVQ